MKGKHSCGTGKAWLAFAVAIIVAAAAHWAIAPAFEGDLRLIVLGDSFSILSALAAVVIGYNAIKKTGINSPQGKSLFCIFLGIASWLVAECLWLFFDITQREFPIVSSADIFWFLGYPLLFAGMIIGMRAIKGLMRREAVVLSLAIFAALLATAVIYIIYPAAADAGSSLAEKLVIIAYPMGDLLIALGAVLIFVPLLGARIGRPWMLIALGMIMFYLSDSTYSYLVHSGTYYVEGLPSQFVSGASSVIYYVAYLLAAMGFYCQSKTFEAEEQE